MEEDKINNLVKDFIKCNLSPTLEEKGFIKERYEELQGLLEGSEIFQSGSYARKTAIKPVNDLDVIWVIPASVIKEKAIKPEELDPEDILRDLGQKLTDGYKIIDSTVRVKPQTHSVGIYFGESDEEFSIDLVPAVSTNEKNEFEDNIYLVPEILHFSKSYRKTKYKKHEEISWIKSDPKGYKEAARIMNEKNDNFRKVAKFIKSWRRHCKRNYPELPLKSFHLELIVNQIFQSNRELNTWGGIKIFFDSLSSYLQTENFCDRADRSRYVDGYIEQISEFDKHEIKELIRLAQKRITALESCGDEEQEVIDFLQLLISGRDDDETFIHDEDIKFIEGGYTFQIAGKVLSKKIGTKSSPSLGVLPEYILGDKSNKVNRNRKINFHIAKSNLPPTGVTYKWKVKNRGKDALNGRNDKGSLRGEINVDKTAHNPEETRYIGQHWVECYAISLDQVCIAYHRQYVVITDELAR